MDGIYSGNRQNVLIDKASSPMGKITLNSGGAGVVGTVPGTNWIAWAFVFNGDSSAIWSNGFQIATGAAGSATSVGDNIGRRYSGSDYLVPGAVAWFQRCGNAGTDVTNMWQWASNRFALP
jgi:hypothetical protein